MHLAASFSLPQRGAAPHSGSLAPLPRWPASTCPLPLLRPLGCLQVVQHDGQEADRVYIMSRISPLVPRITNLNISTITPTFCRPFQHQLPQHQPNPYRPSLHALRRSGSSHRSTSTAEMTSHPRPTTPGSGLPSTPGPFTVGQSEAAPVIATPSAVWRVRRGMGAASLTRKKWGAARRTQSARLASSFIYAGDALTGHLEVYKLGPRVVKTSTCLAPLYDAKLDSKLLETTPLTRTPPIPTATASVTSPAALPSLRASNSGRGHSASWSRSSNSSATRVVPRILTTTSPTTTLLLACRPDFPCPGAPGYVCGPAARTDGSASSASMARVKW